MASTRQALHRWRADSNSKRKVKKRFLVLDIFKVGLFRARPPGLSSVGGGSRCWTDAA